MKIKINKTFQRGKQPYSIRNSIEEDSFILKKGNKTLTLLIGYDGNIWNKMPGFRFETLRPACSFSDPLDRMAIADAIAYLEEQYKTL